jgi:hypothetical protein
VKIMTPFVEFLNRPLKQMAAKKVDLGEFLL